MTDPTPFKRESEDLFRDRDRPRIASTLDVHNEAVTAEREGRTPIYHVPELLRDNHEDVAAYVRALVFQAGGDPTSIVVLGEEDPDHNPLPPGPNGMPLIRLEYSVRPEVLQCESNSSTLTA